MFVDVIILFNYKPILLDSIKNSQQVYL